MNVPTQKTEIATHPTQERTDALRAERLVRRGIVLAAFFVIAFFAAPQSAYAANCVSAGDGNWTAITWTNCAGNPGGDPISTDTVTIRDGDNVVLNTNTTIAGLTIGQGTSGVLTMGDSNTNRSLTVTGSVFIISGAVFDSDGDGGNALLIGADLSNEGSLDFATGNDDVDVTFNGAANQTVSGTATTNSFNRITVNNTGAVNNNIVEISSTSFAAAAGFLTLTDGIFKVSGSFTLTNTFFAVAGYTINSDEGIWLNNASATVTAQGTAVTINGLIRITLGTYNVGTTDEDDLIYGTGSTITIEGGALNIAGNLRGSAAGTTTTYNQSAGTVTVLTVSSSNAFGSFDIRAAGSSFTMSGGSIVLRNATAATDDYQVNAATNSVTGGTVQFGDGSSGAGEFFVMNASTPVFNLVVNTTGSPTLRLDAAASALNDVTIQTGATLLGNGFNLTIGGDWTNSGTFTSGTQTTTFNASSGEQTIAGSSATAFSGLTIANTLTGTTNMTTSGSVAAVLTLTSDLTITDPAVLTQTGTSAGTGDAVGAVRRTNTDGTLRSFGNPFVMIAIGAGGSATVEVFLVKGQPVSGFADAVERTYTITGTAGTGAQVQLHWVDTELNGNDDGGAALHLWREVSGTWTDQGASAANSSIDNWVRNSGVGTFSSWTLASTPSAPTAVKLNRFQAVGYTDGVALAWDSGDEINNLGYHVYRDEKGARVRVTPSVVAGSALRVGVGMRLAAGFSYAWFDSKGSANTGYYLEAIDLNGTRQMFGPIYPMGGKGISPKRQRALMVGELNAAARANGGAISENSWAASLSKAGRSETLRVTADGIARQHEIAAGAAVKVAVSRSGWYRLTQPQLVAAGLDVSGDARFLQLYVDGVELPIRVNGNGIALTASDSIEFYGVALDIPSTDTRTYWLVSGDSHGKRIGGAKRSRNKGDVEFTQAGGTGSFLSTVEVKEKLSYFPNLLNGEAENIFGPLVTDVPSLQTLQVRDVDPQGGNAQLSIAMLGASSHSHAAEVQLNGVVLGTVTFNGQQTVVTNFTVDRAILQQGANTLTFTATSGELDLLFVDWARLTYARQYRADNNALQFSLNGGRTARVTGFTTANVRVFDVTDPNNAAEVESQVAPAGSGFSVMVQARGSGARTLIALADNGIDTQATLTANAPSSWNAGTNGADMVILTHRDFRQAVEPLAALRRDQGLQVSVVDVEDVYDEFGYGAHSPLAVKAFLSWARSNWSRAPRFVLLVGDSSWDPRNYTDEGDNDFVPTRMVDTAHMETASDDWLVDFNGDELADMAIGRLPTRTAAQAALMTGKIIAFEQALDQNAPTRGALMVADNGFEGQSAQTAALLPPGITVQSINRSVVGNDDTTRGQIMTALNEGPSVVNFYGHGSVTVWTGAGLLDNQLAGTLSNTNRLSLFVMMTCLNGYAHDAYTDTLGEAVLKAENGGAVAVWASSGFTEPQPQFALDTEFYRQLFGTESLRLGEATRNAKAAVSDLDVRRTWILFGDPAMRIR